MFPARTEKKGAVITRTTQRHQASEVDSLFKILQDISNYKLFAFKKKIISTCQKILIVSLAHMSKFAVCLPCTQKLYFNNLAAPKV